MILRAAGALLPAPAARPPADADVLEQALLAPKQCAYAQGFQVLAAASREHGWKLPLATIARIWRAGCIIRAGFLDDVALAFAGDPAPDNLLLAPAFATMLGRAVPALRQVVAAAALSGIPAPAFASALPYYDALRSARLPANLIQAQRDAFGAHTFRRTDRPGVFHADWSPAPEAGG